MKSDLLAGLNRRQRLERERADFELMARHPATRPADPKAVPLMRRLGFDVSNNEDQDDREPTLVICSRIDLDHPMVLPDNLIGPCADCDCDIQFRPNLPEQADKLCITCAARRVRESE